ncbi:14378_t:CDS:2, partial [Racocetra fulgida]
ESTDHLLINQHSVSIQTCFDNDKLFRFTIKNIHISKAMVGETCRILIRKSQTWLEESISEERITFLDYNEFTNVEKTNEGGFGTIRKADWKGYGLTVAFKSLKFNANFDAFVNE